ncbi:DUF188 domain-containing protein [Treponema sp.]|uniref:DUF188 domain-containing protein n=1 Tax=Treponema sp. TaxID=166 RepID=UPI00298EB016|nr:DUF188 domain-containing protein [Treponema sp.]MCQ2242440.1 DUF188 domain-containing protein [Treponema sp.]
MKVFVDADNCSKDSRKIILKACTRENIPVELVANRTIPINTQNVNYTMTVCPETKDAADNYIVEKSAGNDIAITRDILLAKRLIEKNIFSMNDKGKVFTKENIGDLIEQRELSLQMKSLGITNGSSFPSQQDTKEFSKKFNEALIQKKKITS